MAAVYCVTLAEDDQQRKWVRGQVVFSKKNTQIWWHIIIFLMPISSYLITTFWRIDDVNVGVYLYVMKKYLILPVTTG